METIDEAYMLIRNRHWSQEDFEQWVYQMLQAYQTPIDVNDFGKTLYKAVDI